MESARVDVILPNYNKADYVRECLTSLKAQIHQNWRCIVVDGGSNDGSWEIIQEYAEGDERFELHRPGRLGLYPSWNYGLDHVRSPYFTILTSDDYWDERWLKSALQGLELNREAVCAAACPYHVDAQSHVLETPASVFLADEIFSSLQEGRADVELRDGRVYSSLVYCLGSVFITAHALVLRTEPLAGLRFATDLGPMADREWYLRIGLRGDVLFFKNVGAYLRRYDEQATSVAELQRGQQHVLVRTFMDRAAGDLRQALEIEAETFRDLDRRIRNYVSFLHSRPTVRFMRKRPLEGIRTILRLLVRNPILLAREICSYVASKPAHSLRMRAELAREMLAAAPAVRMAERHRRQAEDSCVTST